MCTLAEADCLAQAVGDLGKLDGALLVEQAHILVQSGCTGDRLAPDPPRTLAAGVTSKGQGLGAVDPVGDHLRLTHTRIAGAPVGAWTAGKSRAISTPTMAITTKSSISVKPRHRDVPFITSPRGSKLLKPLPIPPVLLT